MGLERERERERAGAGCICFHSALHSLSPISLFQIERLISSPALSFPEIEWSRVGNNGGPATAAPHAPLLLLPCWVRCMEGGYAHYSIPVCWSLLCEGGDRMVKEGERERGKERRMGKGQLSLSNEQQVTCGSGGSHFLLQSNHYSPVLLWHYHHCSTPRNCSYIAPSLKKPCCCCCYYY